jgi:hypothetical protein
MKKLNEIRDQIVGGTCGTVSAFAALPVVTCKKMIDGESPKDAWDAAVKASDKALEKGTEWGEENAETIFNLVSTGLAIGGAIDRHDRSIERHNAALRRRHLPPPQR